MRIDPYISFYRPFVARLMLATALAGSVVLFALDARAQNSAPSQQLPDALVQQQTPPSFPQEDENAAPKGPEVATPDQKAAVSAAETPVKAADEAADGKKTEAAGSEAAKTPDAADVPAQPEQKKLVPSTPMGAAAQSAVAGPDQAAPVSADPAENAPIEPNMEAEAPPSEPDAPNLPDALEKYSENSADIQSAPEQSDGEALPAVNTTTMVRLKGDFPNSNKNVAVPLNEDGTPQKTNEQMKQEIRTEAFDAAITGMFPLSTDQIDSLMQKYDNTQQHVNKPPYDLPKPEISVQNITLDPGVAPPTIKTAIGNVTTINMLDATGAPWPVQDVTWAGDFEVVEPEEGGHIVRITPMAQFARGNIVIRLLTLKTPLTMTLETSRDVVQYRVDARIPEYGPFASAPLMQGGKSSLVAGSPDLTSLLDGVMPGGMERLEVTGVDGRTTAYSMGGTTYVRTPLTLLSPAWQSSVSSADGMNVYELSNAPVLLLSDGGEFMRATLKEKEDLLDE